MNYDSPSDRTVTERAIKRTLIIGFAAFVSYAYFYGGGGYNQNTRFDLVRAIVERGTLSIDAYQENTGDKAFKDGHYYCDKAPGQPLLAVPVAMFARSAMRASGVDPLSASSLVTLSCICTLFSVALPAAVACACLYWDRVALRGKYQCCGLRRARHGARISDVGVCHAFLGARARRGVLALCVCCGSQVER
jgi:hypothetical protein